MATLFLLDVLIGCFKNVERPMQTLSLNGLIVILQVVICGIIIISLPSFVCLVTRVMEMFDHLVSGQRCLIPRYFKPIVNQPRKEIMGPI